MTRTEISMRYSYSLAMNNIGITFLERGDVHLAKSTLRNAVSIIRDIIVALETSDIVSESPQDSLLPFSITISEMEYMLKEANGWLFGRSADTTADIRVDVAIGGPLVNVLSLHDDPQILLNALSANMKSSFVSFGACLFVFQIRNATFTSSLASGQEIYFNAMVILYNEGIIHQCLALKFSGHKSSVLHNQGRYLHTAQRLIHMSFVGLSRVGLSLQQSNGTQVACDDDCSIDKNARVLLTTLQLWNLVSMGRALWHPFHVNEYERKLSSCLGILSEHRQLGAVLDIPRGPAPAA